MTQIKHLKSFLYSNIGLGDNLSYVGKLVVITGPMWAGKTTLLIKELQNEQKKNKNVVLFKCGFDNRYSTAEVVTHNGTKMPAFVLPDDQECVPMLKKIAEDYDVIGIDEGQFWNDTHGLADALNELAFKSKRIYVSMLNTDMAGEAFQISKELIPIADHVYSLKARCAKCGKHDAIFTQRMTPIKPGAKLKDMVGGAGDYEARCRVCFERPKKVEVRNL